MCLFGDASSKHGPAKGQMQTAVLALRKYTAVSLQTQIIRWTLWGCDFQPTDVRALQCNAGICVCAMPVFLEAMPIFLTAILCNFKCNATSNVFECGASIC